MIASGSIPDERSHGRLTQYFYDGLNRLERIEEPNAGAAGQARTFFAYDAVGNRLSSANALGETTYTSYDRLYRPVRTLDPIYAVTSVGYDLTDRRTSLADAVGNTTRWTYDNLGRMTGDTNQWGYARTFAYDAASHLTRQTDRNGRVRTFAYDHLYRPTTEDWYATAADADANSGAGANRLAQFRGQFDDAGHLTSIGQWGDGLTASSTAFQAGSTFATSVLGDVTSVDNRVTENGVVYQTLGLPAVVLAATYQGDHRRTSLSASIGGQADSINAYQYDALSRLTGISQIGAAGPPDANHPPGIGYAASKFVSFSYLADGQFNQVKRYAGSTGSGTPAVTSTYRYDLAGRIEGIQHSNPPAQNLANYNWTWNAANRKASYTNALDSTENVNYAYDRSGQLTSADRLGAAGDETYAFDKNGNRTQRNLGGAAQAYANNRDNELWSDGVFSYQYDHEGNLTKRTKLSDNSTAEYVWDHRNRLLKVTFKDGAGAVQKTVAQSYDPFDRWIGEKSVSGSSGPTLVERHFVYDGDQIALEFGAANQLTHRYLWGPAVDMALADESTSANAGVPFLWLLGDDQHSVRDIVNASGTTVLDHIDYDSFGKVRNETNPAVTHLIGYTGRPFDAETGLANNHRRWYDASTGRWISKDPIGFAAGDANLSRYVGNGPVNATDPSGLFWAEPKIGTQIAIAIRHGDWTLVRQLLLGAGGALNSKGLQQTLDALYSKFPAAAMKCDQAANWTMKLLNHAGRVAVKIRITAPTRAPNFFLKDGTCFAKSGFHLAVYSEGRVYDALTGAEGMTVAEYIAYLTEILGLPPVVTGLPPGAVN